MSGKGNQSVKGVNGDLLITVRVNPSQHFKREGVNIHSNHYITVTEAILGSSTTVRTAYGK
jgi:DnaJ-class molecular chaperone